MVNLGILLTLVGLPTANHWALAIGASTVTGVVLVSYLRLRRMRTKAIGARFTWTGRLYERARRVRARRPAGAGDGDRRAERRVVRRGQDRLGWAGLPLLATLVFFGPTIVRTPLVAVIATARWRLLEVVGSPLILGVLAQTVAAVLTYVAPMLRGRGFGTRATGREDA